MKNKRILFIVIILSLTACETGSHNTVSKEQKVVIHEIIEPTHQVPESIERDIYTKSGKNNLSIYELSLME